MLHHRHPTHPHPTRATSKPKHTLYLSNLHPSHPSHPFILSQTTMFRAQVQPQNTIEMRVFVGAFVHSVLFSEHTCPPLSDLTSSIFIFLYKHIVRCMSPRFYIYLFNLAHTTTSPAPSDSAPNSSWEKSVRPLVQSTISSSAHPDPSVCTNNP